MLNETHKNLMAATASVYAERWERDELVRLMMETKDDIDRATLKMAINIKNEAYGKQLTLELK